MALRSGAVSETSPESDTYFTVSFASPKIAINCCRISSGEWPGKIRQFTLACAVCGSALLACPAASRVATQVVLKFAVEARLCAKPRGRGHIRRRGQNRPHVRLRLPRLLPG